MTDGECYIPNTAIHKRKAAILAEVNRHATELPNTCPHGQGAHWVGDCGDLDAIPKADWITRANNSAVAKLGAALKGAPYRWIPEGPVAR